MPNVFFSCGEVVTWTCSKLLHVRTKQDALCYVVWVTIVLPNYRIWYSPKLQFSVAMISFQASLVLAF